MRHLPVSKFPSSSGPNLTRCSRLIWSRDRAQSRRICLFRPSKIFTSITVDHPPDQPNHKRPTKFHKHAEKSCQARERRRRVGQHIASVNGDVCVPSDLRRGYYSGFEYSPCGGHGQGSAARASPSYSSTCNESEMKTAFALENRWPNRTSISRGTHQRLLSEPPQLCRRCPHTTVWQVWFWKPKWLRKSLHSCVCCRPFKCTESESLDLLH